MKNQGITQKSLENELGMRRQTISKRIEQFENGDRIREEHVEKRFKAIIAQEELNRSHDSKVSVSEIEDKQIKALERSIEGLKARIIERYKFDPELVESAIVNDDGTILVETLINSHTIDNMAKNEHGGVDVTDLGDILHDIHLLALKRDLRKAIDEADSYSALWDNTNVVNGRAIDYEFLERDHFFSLYDKDKCQIYANPIDFIDPDFKENYLEFEIGVLTNKRIEVISKKRGVEIDSERYMASFDNLLPGFKYFFRVKYIRVFSDEDREFFSKGTTAWKDKTEITHECSQFYPLKPAI